MIGKQLMELCIVMEIIGSRSFSNRFDKTNNRKLIGLYDSASFARLWIIIIFAIFHWKEASSKNCITWVIYFIIISGSLCSIHWLNWNLAWNLELLFGFTFFITALTSLIVQGYLGRRKWCQRAIYFPSLV
jgi:hypothetical protein